MVSCPEITTQLGVPILYDLNKYDLDDISDERLWKDFNKQKENYATLLSYDFDRQSPENQLNTKILEYYTRVNYIEKEPFFYHDYPVNQMFGEQNNLPSFMVSSHKLKSNKDIEAYITRLSKFDTKFSQVIDNLKIRESKGIILPRFIISIVLDEMKGFVGQSIDTVVSESVDPMAAVRSNILYTNFAEKVDELENITEDQKHDYKERVADAIEETVFPAYQSLIDG